MEPGYQRNWLLLKDCEVKVAVYKVEDAAAAYYVVKFYLPALGVCIVGKHGHGSWSILTARRFAGTYKAMLQVRVTSAKCVTVVSLHHHIQCKSTVVLDSWLGCCIFLRFGGGLSGNPPRMDMRKSGSDTCKRVLWSAVAVC